MPDTSPKTRFVKEYAARSGMAEHHVRERIRAVRDAGIGARQLAPLGYTDVASYLIAILASPTNRDAGAIVERFSSFFLKAADFHPELFPATLPPLPQTPLRQFLAGIIRAFNEAGGISLISLSADWPPHDAFRICVISTEGMPYTATFAPEVVALRRMHQPDLHCHTVTLPGGVVEAVAYLATPDD
jgi:hypothetical protein